MGKQSSGLLRLVAPEAAAIDPRVVSEAANWLTRLRESPNAEESLAFERWLAISPAHELACRRLSTLLRGVSEGVADMGADFAVQTLEHACAIRSRRQAVRWMLGGAGIGLGLLAARERDTLRTWAADVRVSTGERRALVLQDGTQVELNTGTALDIHYTASVRELVLHTGEILVTTGHQDPSGRPFSVRTHGGVLAPVGTRFIVRDLEGSEVLRVGVMEGAVEMYDADGRMRRIEAGQQAVYTRAGFYKSEPLQAATSAWLDNMIVADEMPLIDFLAELRRYRSGLIQCAPDIAHLSVVGAFPLGDSDKVLAMLTEVLPIRIRYFTRYWLNVVRA